MTCDVWRFLFNKVITITKMFRKNIAVFLVVALMLLAVGAYGARVQLNVKIDEMYVAGLHPKTAGQVYVFKRDLIIMKDNMNAIYFRRGEWRDKWTTAQELTLDRIDYIFKVDVVNGLSPEFSLALAQKLVGKRLPYGAYLCNEVNYMRYILGGDPYYHWFKRDCLTARPIQGVTLYYLNRGRFGLQDGNGNYFEIGALEPFTTPY